MENTWTGDEGGIWAEVVTEGLSEEEKSELEMKERKRKDSWVWGLTNPGGTPY